jgi:hypothetical protein
VVESLAPPPAVDNLTPCRLYESRAIAGYAHGRAQGTPLRPEDFSGGNATVATVLRTLGFDVSVRGPVAWTRDELVLACALVEGNGWRQVDASDPRVRELSELLRRATIHDHSLRGPDFRSPSSVALKTANIATHHPDHTGRPTNGNRLDREVLHDFLARPAEMRQLAASLRAAVTEGADQRPTRVPDLDEDVTAVEGGLLHRRHLRRERDPRLRRAKLADARARGQAIACEVCGFRLRPHLRPTRHRLHRVPPPHTPARHRPHPHRPGRPRPDLLQLPPHDPPRQPVAHRRTTPRAGDDTTGRRRHRLGVVGGPPSSATSVGAWTSQ